MPALPWSMGSIMEASGSHQGQCKGPAAISHSQHLALKQHLWTATPELCKSSQSGFSFKAGEKRNGSVFHQWLNASSATHNCFPVRSKASSSSCQGFVCSPWVREEQAWTVLRASCPGCNTRRRKCILHAAFGCQASYLATLGRQSIPFHYPVDQGPIYPHVYKQRALNTITEEAACHMIWAVYAEPLFVTSISLHNSWLGPAVQNIVLTNLQNLKTTNLLQPPPPPLIFPSSQFLFFPGHLFPSPS